MAGVKKSGRTGRTGTTKRAGLKVTATRAVRSGRSAKTGTTGTTKKSITKGTTGSSAGTLKKGTTGTSKKTITKGTKGRTKGTTASKARKEPVNTRGRPTAPVRTVVRIRELDPYRKCGPGTSVGRLIRVDTEVAGRKEAHLVYYDRHGWYCEHGRTCDAVKHARKGVSTTR